MKMLAMLVLAATMDWTSVVVRLQKAAPAGDVEQLRAVRAELTAAEPQTNLTRYTRAYVNRVLAFSRGTTVDERRTLLAEALELLGNEKDAESLALRGAIEGAMIGVDPSRAPELGAAARSSLERAAKLAPHNPRVLLLLGTSAFHRPVEYGGGPEVAERHLRRALELFRNEPEAKPWPNWGRFDAHVYLGQSMEKLQRADEALRHYEAALAIAPQSEYVRRVLMPRVRR
ncbi:MAG TPA: tetratricopeptide repeat protein [Thermoanaerobaculia bacterium]|nr:tetratricopeptide repeat protein [Thermoanaerobaculia bacterium]